MDTLIRRCVACPDECGVRLAAPRSSEGLACSVLYAGFAEWGCHPPIDGLSARKNVLSLIGYGRLRSELLTDASGVLWILDLVPYLCADLTMCIKD